MAELVNEICEENEFGSAATEVAEHLLVSGSLEVTVTLVVSNAPIAQFEETLRVFLVDIDHLDAW